VAWGTGNLGVGDSRSAVDGSTPQSGELVQLASMRTMPDYKIMVGPASLAGYSLYQAAVSE
jgi:hypothetical protein